MKKNLLIVFSIVYFFISFYFNICLANDDMLKNTTDATKNIINNSEEAIENTSKDITNKSQNMTENMENKFNNYSNNYDSTKTSTNNSETSYMGMSSNAWTWLILGITSLAIIGLIWYYSMQTSSSNYDDME